MGFLILFLFIFIVWLFTSASKTEDVRRLIKGRKVLQIKMSKLSKQFEEVVDQTIKNAEEEKIREANKLDEDIEELLKGISYQQIVQRPIELKSKNHNIIDIDTFLEFEVIDDKLAKVSNDTVSIEDVNKYAGEVDSYLVDFLKIRFYLAGKRGYPDLQCVDQYFNFRFSNLDKISYSSIWQNIVSATIFDSSKCKNIDSIYHFTHKSNLSSILEYGILTRTNLNDMNLRYAFNDQMRLDGVLDSISLSFSHPNFKMFYKYRKQTSDDDWVVLKISPSLIYGREQCISNGIKDFNYLNKAVFCHTNAASNKMRNLSIEERMTFNAFLDMFESPIGRALPTYTYDNQAEILYLGNIPVDFIEEIYTNHQDESLNWVRKLGYKVTENDIVFDQRRYRDG